MFNINEQIFFKSLLRAVQVMKVDLGFPERCRGCGACYTSCTIEAIEMVGGRPAIDKERCSGGGRCIDVCPTGALVYI